MKLSDFKKLVAELPAELDNCEVVFEDRSNFDEYFNVSGVTTDLYYIPLNRNKGGALDEATLRTRGMTDEEWKTIKNNRAIIIE